MSPLSIEPSLPASESTRPQPLLQEISFTIYFFSRDKMPIDMNMLVFFLGKCVRTAAKAIVVDIKTRRH